MPLGNNTATSQTTQETEVEETEVEQTATTETSENIPDVEMIVENGTGVPNANSYVDLDFALEYCVTKGYTNWLSLSENEQKTFLIRGTEFVDNFYQWKGRRFGQFQSLYFPRVDLYDNDNFPVTGIPARLKKACVEAAFLNASSGSDSLFTTKDENGKIKKQKVDTLEVEYFDSSTSTSESSVDYTSIYDVLNKLLKGLYKTKDEVGSVCTKAIYSGW